MRVISLLYRKLLASHEDIFAMGSADRVMYTIRNSMADLALVPYTDILRLILSYRPLH